jgi:hypothetical protein
MLVPAADKISDPALLGYGKAGYDQKRAQESEARRYGFASGRHSYGEDSSGWRPVLSVDEGGASLVGGFFAVEQQGFFNFQFPSKKHSWLSVSLSHKSLSLFAGILTIILWISIVPVWCLLSELEDRKRGRTRAHAT